MRDKIQVVDFPPIFRPIAVRLGVDDALAIVRQWEGKRFYVPIVAVTPANAIAQSMGVDVAEEIQSALADEFGWSWSVLIIPRLRGIEIRCKARLRREYIHVNRYKLSIGQMAIDRGLSRKQVYQVLRNQFKTTV